MPRSLSKGFASIINSPTCWWALKTWPCFNSASTSVVLPWSTWAMIARLRIALFWHSLKFNHPTHHHSSRAGLLSEPISMNNPQFRKSFGPLMALID